MDKFLPALLLVVASTLIHGTAQAAESNKPTLAVLTFDVDQGVTKNEARILADRLAIELDSNPSAPRPSAARPSSVRRCREHIWADGCGG